MSSDGGENLSELLTNMTTLHTVAPLSPLTVPTKVNTSISNAPQPNIQNQLLERVIALESLVASVTADKVPTSKDKDIDTRLNKLENILTDSQTEKTDDRYMALFEKLEANFQNNALLATAMKDTVQSNQHLIVGMHIGHEKEMALVRAMIQQSAQSSDVVMSKMTSAMGQFSTGVVHISEIMQAAVGKMQESQTCASNLMTSMKTEMEQTSTNLTTVVIEMQHLLFQNSVALNGEMVSMKYQCITLKIYTTCNDRYNHIKSCFYLHCYDSNTKCFFQELDNKKEKIHFIYICRILSDVSRHQRHTSSTKPATCST